MGLQLKTPCHLDLNVQGDQRGAIEVTSHVDLDQHASGCKSIHYGYAGAQVMPEHDRKHTNGHLKTASMQKKSHEGLQLETPRHLDLHMQGDRRGAIGVSSQPTRNHM